MKIPRTTHVISISMPKKVVEKLEKSRQISGQSRSAFISSLIDSVSEEQRWQKIYQRGAQTARDFKITSEDDIDRILHEERG